jgi:hypothetical protein
MGEERTVYKVLVGKPEEKRPLERPGNRWEDEIRMDLGFLLGGGCVECIKLAQDRDRWRVLVNTVMNLQILASRSQLIITTSQKKRINNGYRQKKVTL